MDSKIPIICVIGPTASGKTRKAIELAKEHNGEIISVDSRQVYKMLDIGTEKITEQEMDNIPHHLINIRDPKDVYTAGDFVEDADRLIKEILKRGKTPILAGGTHFYFHALLYGIPNDVKPNMRLREELETYTTEELVAEIQSKDPKRAKALDPKNRRRLMRALEIVDAHGFVPEAKPKQSRYNITWVVMDASSDDLRERLEFRLKQTLKKGLVAEVERVRNYVGDKRLNELGLEYKIVGEYLRGERTEDSLVPALVSKLWQYAKQQKVWVKRLTSG